MDMEKLRVFIQKHPMIAYPLVGLGALGIWSLLMMSTAHEPKKEPELPKSSPIGLSAGGADQQAYLARLEKNYYDFEERVKVVEKQNKSIAKMMLKLDEKLTSKIDERFNEFQQTNNNMGASASGSMELAVADIKPIQKNEDDFVYLPMGSFCKGTLLTSVYAATDANNPLPVLITLEEAFYGPNKTRIPLKGAFVLGKAYGDLVSERALIQITAISSVLPDGHAFEREENLGYVTDEFGELGIRGRVIRNTGRQLALSFMGGFMSGGAQAVADGEVTTTDTRFGGVRKDVTGDATKNTIFSGLSKSAGRMSEYYEKQAEGLVPAVHIRNGATVYFIVQKGVHIDGLPRADYARASVIN